MVQRVSAVSGAVGKYIVGTSLHFLFSQSIDIFIDDDN